MPGRKWCRQCIDHKKKLTRKPRRCNGCGRPCHPKRARCWGCKATKREAELPHLAHDRKYHAKLMESCLNPKARCCITGFSQHTLRKLGDNLSVDRIDPNLGYVKGNCQLMATSLNLAKGRGREVPASAISALRARRARATWSIHDSALQA